MFNLFNLFKKKASKTTTYRTRVTVPGYYSSKNFDSQMAAAKAAAAKAAAPKQKVSGRQVGIAYYPGQVVRPRMTPVRQVHVAYYPGQVVRPRMTPGRRVEIVYHK